MNVGSQAIPEPENPFAAAFRISVLIFVLLGALFLHILGVQLTVFVLLLATAALVWMALYHPIGSLGAFLAFMPIFPMAALLGEYFGPPYMALASGCSRVVLLLLICILWRQNGIKLKAPDWFLLACFGLAALRLALGGML